MRKILGAIALLIPISYGAIGASSGAGGAAANHIAIESIVGPSRGPFTAGDGDSLRPSASVDGRFVVFDSDATTLAPGDTNTSTDVLLRDNATGTVTRISAKLANGHETDDDSFGATIANNGTRVAYVSNADGITADDRNGGGDAYVYDVAARTTTRVSVTSGYPGGNPDGNDDGFDYTTQAAISGDGNWVAFTTDNGLSIVDANVDNDVYLRDLVHRTTIRLSGSRNGDPDFGGGSAAAPSKDACDIAFVSDATDIVPSDTNGTSDVFVYDRCGHSKATSSTQKRVRVSVTPAGNQSDGPSTAPQISANGRYVAFASKATNLVAPAVSGTFWQVYVRDRDADGNGVFDEPGAGKTTTKLISSPSAGVAANRDAVSPAISADGCAVAFASDATNLGAGGDAKRQIFTVDRCAGAQVRRVTVATNGATAPNGTSDHPSFTADGDEVLFDSAAQNLVAGDTNGGTPADDAFAAQWRTDRQAPLVANSSVAIPSTSVWVLDTGADDFRPSWLVWDPSGVQRSTVDLGRYLWNKAGLGTNYAPFFVDTTASSGTFSASVPGTTYCMRVSAATDTVGNTARVNGPSTCRALPLTSTQLTYGSGWTKYNPAGAYAGVAYKATGRGATMTRTFLAADRLALIAATCAACGTADVYWNGSLLAHVDLTSATSQAMVAIPLATWTTMHSGTLTMVVTSNNLSVVVEGLGVYQDH